MPLFISDEEFSRCSGDTTAVAAKADSYIRSLLLELDTVRAKADASDINAEQNCSLIEQKYLSLAAEFSKLESHVSDLQSSLDQRQRELSDVQSQNHQFQLQLVEKDREIERLKTEVNELHKAKRQLIELNEQKDSEHSEKSATIKSYLDKFIRLSENAALKEARLTEAEAELVRSRAACARLEQEKEIVERQNAWLNEELTAKVNSFNELRKRHTELDTDLTSKLADVERQFSECSKSLEWNKGRVKELEIKLKSMQEELITAKDAAAANEERFSAEISTVNKLNELYKESSEEWSRKAADLEGGVKAMESYLKQVEDDYKEKLEKESSARKQVEKEAADLKEKLEKFEAEIEASKKSNELINLPLSSFSTEPLLTSIVADGMVEENNMLVPKIPFGVSGTALAASLLRDGWSLAKMYAKYQEAVDAFRHEQLGRKESEAILQRVLYELEEKAEAIIDERVEHEKMVDTYSLMSQKLQNSLNDNSNLEKTIQELKADLKRHEREYNLAQKENDDLRKQVTVLLKECRDIQLRSGSNGNDVVDVASNIALRTSRGTEPEDVISDHIQLTFKDINGLVEQNVQLRSLVRSLSGQIENQEVEYKEKLEMELKKHTEEAGSKVAAVLQRAEEQGNMIESLHASVAMYKRLYEEEHSLHLSHAHSSEALAAVSEVRRNNLKTSIESSQEIAKKSLEKAAERVRSLEDDLAKSRSEIIVLRTERDKILLEANFARERLDSSMKEIEHQKAEAKGILARNVEFSQLIVDYQRKLRESSDSLNAAEELTRKLSMELSILKHEKEVISNAEKRASDEVRSLSERVQSLQASLSTIQSAEEVREEARAAEKVKQEEYIKKLEREWAEAKKELQDERENVQRLTLDREQAMKNYMRQVEDTHKELANALSAVASAESRASVAEVKLSSLQRKMGPSNEKLVEVDGVSGPSTLSSDEVVAELQTAKEEIEKLKEEAQANKAHMLQYKSIAEVNEDAMKQIEIAHDNYKIEVDNAKKALELEVHALREKVSELENESSLKFEEVASATAGKEEALTSALAEISNLKEEILNRCSQISAMELQISDLKEQLDKEHQKWRAAQTNYERQVILQSETIQELTKTSEALALLQEEASKLRTLADAQKIENRELKAKWEEEKAGLERSKNDAEKKYDEINEQNKILHSQLEALHIQWAEKERNAAGISSGSSSADTFSDAGLQNVISYLRRSKEIAVTEVSLLKQEKLRLQSQLESALKASESAHASLEAERAKSRSFLFSEEEFKSLQLQLREINLLRESNVQLREENKYNFEECQKLREVAQKARVETENLENLLREREILLESHNKEIETLKLEKDNLNYKVTELLERCKNVDVEDYDRVKKLVRDLQDKLRDRDAQIEETAKVLSEKQDSVSRLEQDLSNCRSELMEREKRINDILHTEANLKQDTEKHRKLLAQFKKKIDALSREKEDLVKENQQLSKQLDEIKGKRLTSDTTAEQAMKEEMDTRIQTLEKTVARLRDEVKKEREDKNMERNRRLKTEKAIKDSYNNVEQEKKQFINELERHKEALKRLSDEVEKLKIVVGNLPEGSDVAQLLSGPNVDDFSAIYMSAVENFEKVAQSVISEFGGRGNLGDATATTDGSAAATGSVVHAQSQSIIPLAASGTSNLPPKATGESEKRLALPKSVVETRKAGRRLVRPRLVKQDEPQGDVEMSETEGLGGKPGPSSDTETQSNLALSSQPLARKRVAPTSTSELLEESVAPGDKSSEPLVKKSRGVESQEETGEEPPAATSEFSGSHPATEESFESGELPQGQNEELGDAQNDDGETAVSKDEESKDPQQFDGTTSQEELQGDKTGISEENPDQSAEAKILSDEMQMDHPEPDNQQPGSDREEGEMLPETGDSEGEPQESREGPSDPVASPEPSPARVDDEGLEAGEINSPDLSSEDKNDEGDLVEEAADGSDKLIDVNETTSVESDPVAEPAPVASESLTSNRMARLGCFMSVLTFLFFVFIGLMSSSSEAAIKKYQFDVQVTNVSRLCHAKPIVTVNGRFPGPTIYVREGDTVLINVTNHAQYNMSIHWHGLKQYRNGWADGPAYITQCPIQTGSSYTYNFNVTGQRGTLWWHAHILWLRATVYGAIVIMPKPGTPFPFPQPDREFEVLLGEWWNNDVEEIEKQGNKMGLPPNMSDAHTINGKPGPLFPCSEKHTYAMEVEQGKTYLLRIINAALNDELFFAIAGHNMTVVEVDAVYTKPFTTEAILIAPGQTTNVLVQANQVSGRYFMATKAFMDAPIPVDNKTATAILQYRGIPNTVLPSLPHLPASNDTGFALSYNKKIRSLNSVQYPANVPLRVDRKLLYTISLGKNSCPTCINGTRLVASLNNVTFVMPKTALLQAHYFNNKGVFRTDFPDRPSTPFNYTGAPLTANLATITGTRVSKVAFNSTVELVLQDTNLLSVESHPFHLHGYNFFVVGTGTGNFNPSKDPAKYNLVDPIERNTVGVPTGGWTAIRFQADNPGVWFFHCHLELHTGWGLKTAFVVENGPGQDQSVLPPPKDLPAC